MSTYIERLAVRRGEYLEDIFSSLEKAQESFRSGNGGYVNVLVQLEESKKRYEAEGLRDNDSK